MRQLCDICKRDITNNFRRSRMDDSVLISQVPNGDSHNDSDDSGNEDEDDKIKEIRRLLMETVIKRQKVSEIQQIFRDCNSTLSCSTQVVPLTRQQ